MRRVCVYCGSRAGARPAYVAAARLLAAELGRRGLALVYGGASVGIMGELADAALAAGCEVFGVLPRGLFHREVAHRGLTELFEVESMHERKAKMAALADGFIALPGGFGTLEELFEALTWTQIGIHAKPCGLLDVEGYYRHLTAFLDHTVEEGFVAVQNRNHLVVETGVVALLDGLESRVRDVDGDDGGLAVEWATPRSRK